MGRTSKAVLDYLHMKSSQYSENTDHVGINFDYIGTSDETLVIDIEDLRKIFKVVKRVNIYNLNIENLKIVIDVWMDNISIVRGEITNFTLDGIGAGFELILDSCIIDSFIFSNNIADLSINSSTIEYLNSESRDNKIVRLVLDNSYIAAGSFKVVKRIYVSGMYRPNILVKALKFVLGIDGDWKFGFDDYYLPSLMVQMFRDIYDSSDKGIAVELMKRMEPKLKNELMTEWLKMDFKEVGE